MESPCVEAKSVEPLSQGGSSLPDVPPCSQSSESLTKGDPAQAGSSSGPATATGPARPAVPPRSKVKAADVRDAAQTEERPVPAPRRSVAPTPAPRTRSFQTSSTVDTADKCCGPSPQSSSSSSSGSKVRTRHPWLSIIYQSPWTRPPPTPADLPPHFWTLPPSELLFYRHKRHPRSSCSEVMRATIDEDKEVHLSSSKKFEALDSHKPRGEKNHPGPEPQLSRSLSVPALSSHMPTNRFSTSSQTQLVSGGKRELPKSKTSQELSSRRSSAPGHGFPLIKRKTRPALDVSTDVRQDERASLDQQLQNLELRGAELERRLRDGSTDGEGERMMMDWLRLVEERNVLVRRDLELAQLNEQQRLEERQADVEYELRCLLNKPESNWTDEERAGEKQLMNTLVSVVEERNKIINTFEQDRQREREDDNLWNNVMKSKELQKEGLEEMRRSKAKISLTEVLKRLSHKTETNGAEAAS